MRYTDIRDGGYLDEHGWPTSIPAELKSIGTIFAWGDNAYGQGETRKGRYVLTYEGKGDLQLILIDDKQIIEVKPGRIIFDIKNNEGNWGFNIYDTDPKGTKNYIRNIKIIKENQLELYSAGAIFNPDWLASIRDVRQVRFMDMMGTNGSKIAKWEEQRKIDDHTWSGNVPVEVQVRLANEIGADPWFNMPFHADNNYVRKFSNYVHDNLDPDLIASVELSNEVWNWSFQQARDAKKMSINEWDLDSANAGAGGNFYGKRASEVMKIWTEVFGNETSTRLKRIAATQAVNDWLSQQILNAPKWKKHDPDGYVPPHMYFDALSVAAYFGGGVIRSQKNREALFAVMDDPTVNNFDFHYRLIKGEIDGLGNFLKRTVDALQSQRTVAEKYDLELIAYEGGQHVHHSAHVSIPEADLQRLQNHLIGFVRSQQMADLYQELWDKWKQIGAGPFMQFVDIGAPSKYGSWGLRASLSDTSPRAVLLKQFNANTPAWWESRGGDHFRQGVIRYGTGNSDTLSGTHAEDYLIGRGGDDIFYPGPGNDGINGGAGTDSVLFRGINQSTLFHLNGMAIA
ncbi:MAG: hypothetical protein RNU03_16030 [Candidatus Sedimenticola sp. (ex Thyasira tokunagai)]